MISLVRIRSSRHAAGQRAAWMDTDAAAGYRWFLRATECRWAAWTPLPRDSGEGGGEPVRHRLNRARYSRTRRQPQTGMIFRSVADVPGCWRDSAT